MENEEPCIRPRKWVSKEGLMETLNEKNFSFLHLPYQKDVEKMDKVTWIPCTERLPEDGGQKLCTHFCDTCEAMKSPYLVWAAPYNDGWCCDERVTGKVTHWMPLPLPPKQIS